MPFSPVREQAIVTRPGAKPETDEQLAGVVYRQGVTYAVSPNIPDI